MVLPTVKSGPPFSALLDARLAVRLYVAQSNQIIQPDLVMSARSLPAGQPAVVVLVTAEYKRVGDLVEPDVPAI